MLDPDEAVQEKIDDAQRLTRRLEEEAFRRKMQQEEVLHKATMLGSFYIKLIEMDVPEDVADTLTQAWLESGMPV